MPKKKYTLPAPEQIVAASAFNLVRFSVEADTGGANVQGEWWDGGGNVIQPEVIGLSKAETDALLEGYDSGTQTFEERVLSWLAANGKLTAGGSVEDQ